MQSLFRYIWKNSRREQIIILVIVVTALPFYFISLDIPKYIINDAIQGRAFAEGRDTVLAFRMATPSIFGLPSMTIFEGVRFNQVQYLFALSAAFLLLVLINGAFKYVINLRKGVLGERLLQGLRLDLFKLLLRINPEAARHVKPSEAATVIKDEVEPIGGFVGDAFVQPVFLGGQAATALAFILLQNLALGLIAAIVVLAQAIIIPRLRREQVRLAKQRQARSRALAGRIGEAVGGLAEISNHGASNYERARVSSRLEELFDIRYKLFRRKFSVKFLNNLLAQATPFVFYSIGGYYVLKGSLDVGQLVAVIAAYRELPPPVKELIDWDQQRVDVEVKYQQIMEQFASVAAAEPDKAHGEPAAWNGAIECHSLTVTARSGDTLLDRASATIPLGKHVALLSFTGDGGGVMAETLGRRITQYEGEIRIAGFDLASIPREQLGARTAYAGPDPVIFDASVRDNILYGLASKRDGPIDRYPEDEGLHQRIREIALAVGLEDDIYRFGLGRRIDPSIDAEISTSVVEARRAIRLAIDAEAGPRVIESFDPATYNHHSTILENLLFGALDERAKGVDGASLFALLDEQDAAKPLAEMGKRIAATLVEIFADLDPENFLFQRFSFLTASQIDFYRELLMRIDSHDGATHQQDAGALISLAFLYVEPQHRLGLLTSELEARILAARFSIAAKAGEIPFTIEHYDPDRICRLANMRDNLLFGRVAREVPGAETRVLAVLRRVCAETGLDHRLFRLGLDYEAGQNGCMLFPGQRQAVSLVRCLIKEPEILILNHAITPALGEFVTTLANVRRIMTGRTLIFATQDPDLAQSFDAVIRFDGPRLRKADEQGTSVQVASKDARNQADAEIAALSALSIFSELDMTQLKLLAFASERLLFSPGDVLLRQGEAADSAYVIVDGEAEVVWEQPSERIRLNTVGKNSLVGEMSIITGAPRTATVVALTEITALRIRAEVLFGLITEFPQISLAIMRDQIRRIVLRQDQIITQQQNSS